MKRAFTLTELIVVIMIISILLTFTLPGIVKSRNKIYQTVCINNLRNIGVAINSYSSENNDFSMPASFGETDDGYLNHFINYMISRMEMQEKSFQCPSLSADQMFDPDGHDPAVGNIYTEAAYIMNIIKPGNWTGANISGKGTAHGWGYDSVTPIPYGLITRPSEKFHVMDVISDIYNTHSGINYFSRTDHGQVNSPPTGFSRWVGLQHNFGYNVLFGDGHVENQKHSDHVGWAVNR